LRLIFRVFDFAPSVATSLPILSAARRLEYSAFTAYQTVATPCLREVKTAPVSPMLPPLRMSRGTYPRDCRTWRTGGRKERDAIHNQYYSVERIVHGGENKCGERAQGRWTSSRRAATMLGAGLPTRQATNKRVDVAALPDLYVESEKWNVSYQNALLKSHL
jgi:hypothetical protein